MIKLTVKIHIKTMICFTAELCRHLLMRSNNSGLLTCTYNN